MSRFSYFCANCSGTVTKKPTGTVTNKTTRAGLHGWSCSGCGAKGCKVVRKLNKDRD